MGLMDDGFCSVFVGVGVISGAGPATSLSQASFWQGG